MADDKGFSGASIILVTSWHSTITLLCSWRDTFESTFYTLAAARILCMNIKKSTFDGVIPLMQMNSCRQLLKKYTKVPNFCSPIEIENVYSLKKMLPGFAYVLTTQDTGACSEHVVELLSTGESFLYSCFTSELHPTPAPTSKSKVAEEKPRICCKEDWK